VKIYIVYEYDKPLHAFTTEEAAKKMEALSKGFSVQEFPLDGDADYEQKQAYEVYLNTETGEFENHTYVPRKYWILRKVRGKVEWYPFPFVLARSYVSVAHAKELALEFAKADPVQNFVWEVR
jgi:hypothetical protein